MEPNGKLRDKVRVRGEVEVHPEGHYYIEWWQDGRKREQIKDRAEVLDRARRKAVELEANRAGIETVQENGNGNGPTITKAVAAYLKDVVTDSQAVVQSGRSGSITTEHYVELLCNAYEEIEWAKERRLSKRTFRSP